MAAQPGIDAPLRLLIVEDNPDDVELIRLKLEGVVTDRRFVIEAVDRLSTAVRRLKGADVVILAGVANRLVFSFMARPEIKSFGDLKGKKIGITRLGSSTHS